MGRAWEASASSRDGRAEVEVDRSRAADIPDGAGQGRLALPQATERVLGELFKLGALTSRMAVALHGEPVSQRTMQRLLKQLSELGLVQSKKLVVSSSPASANMVDPDGGAETFLKPQTLRRPEKVYELTDEGKSWVAGDQEMAVRRIHQLYAKTHSPGRRQHSLLRNEYIVMLVEGQDSESSNGGYGVLDYCAEAGTGPIELERGKNRGATRSLTPDGLVAIESQRDGALGTSGTNGIFIEADTGQQRGEHIKEKIHQYSELYLSQLLALEDGAGMDERSRILASRANRWLPTPVTGGRVEYGVTTPVVFVSYYGDRTGALRKLVEQAHKEDGMFRRLGRYMNEQGLGSAASVFLCTNLQALRNRGVREAYWTASEPKPRRLL